MQQGYFKTHALSKLDLAFDAKGASVCSVVNQRSHFLPKNGWQRTVELISKILPDVLVKGKDWAHYVSGREIVEAHGGRVVLADMVEGRSTTATIARMRSADA